MLATSLLNDWEQYVFDQPMDTLPGTKWIYNSGASHFMSVIIKKATGLHLDEFAEKYLFPLLGIENYHWKKPPKGFPDAEGGLYLEAEDLAKIGQLVLNKGIWKDKQIASGQMDRAEYQRTVRFHKFGSMAMVISGGGQIRVVLIL